jgi:hypothetical protein
MDEQTHTFTSHHGTLIVKPDGVTIKRTWAQALQGGRLSSRTQTIPYEALKEVRHQRISTSDSYLQLTTKPGTVKSTPFNRHARLRFDDGQAHHFRQAQRLIEAKLAELAQTDHAPEPDISSAETPDQASPYRPSGMTFKKP